MASYFQNYFQASSMPKRLLQYALSRLEILDTEALDLENLDIAWGKNSTFEFKDVGLRLKKLETLLQLPPTIGLIKAKVLLLRITIPVDIYSSPISVEVEGVDCQLKVREEKGAYTSRTNHDRLRKKSTSRSLETDPTLPTAADLAASFLQTEPREERAELEAAILGETQQDISASVSSSEDGEVSVGTGTALSLPAFMARFLQGIVDRLQVRVRGITFNVDVDIPVESPTPNHTMDPVTVQLKIDDVDIEGVTHDIESTRSSGGKDFSSLFREGKRLICLSNIRGALISEANLFQTLSRSSSVVSPVVTYSDISESRPTTEEHPSAEETALVSLESAAVFEGAISPNPPSSPALLRRASASSLPEIRRPPPPSRTTPPLKASMVASNGGRFGDASEDGHSNRSNSMHEDISSKMGDSILQNPAYLGHITVSQLLDDHEQNNVKVPSVIEKRQSASGENSRTSTPRASTHISPSSQALQMNEYPDLARSESLLHPTMLPPRTYTRFSVERVSHSQLELPPMPAPLNRSYSVQQPGPVVDVDATSESASSVKSASNIDMGDDLAQSQLFSHEDAESMYMSALSYTSAVSTQVPGSWADSGTERGDARPPPTTPRNSNTHAEHLDNLEHARHAFPLDGATDIHSMEKSTTRPSRSPHESTRNISSMRPETPRQSPTLQQVPSNVSMESTSSGYSRMTKQLFSLDQVAIYVPALNDPSSDPVDAAAESALFSSTFDGHNDLSRSMSSNLPGSFSTHLPKEQSSRTSSKSTPRAPLLAKNSDEEKSIEVEVGDILAQFDVSIGRLIYKLVCQIQESMKQEPRAAASSKPTPSAPQPHLKINFEEISLRFVEQLEGVLGSRFARSSTKILDSDILLKTTLRGLKVSRKSYSSTIKTGITLQKFLFGYAQENIISFEAGLQMRASVRDLSASAGIDVSIDMSQNPDTTRIEVQTLPLHVAIDLQRLDETFSWFGGLSSVLNLGNSMASNVTSTSSPVAKPKPRVVRFNTSIEPNDRTVAAQNKADVRIGGLVLDLVGTECSIGVETSAVKLVNREEGIGIGINNIRLSGPHLKHSNEDPAILVDVSLTRIEFMNAPKDADIERLLRLISPSRSTYEQDDDILLDTLLRQRSQGSVLRVTVDDLQVKMGKLHELNYLPELGEEVARLSTVAKYLPDDDRPGLLSLIMVKNIASNVDINKTVGSVQFKATDLDVAQIPLPSLVALSVGTVSAHRNRSEELIGTGTDQIFKEAESRSPMIMARVIGDEMEPIVRIKLWNMRAEYRVPTLMVLLGLADSSTEDDSSASLTASVATLRDLIQPPTSKDKGKGKSVDKTPTTSNSQAKPMTIDIILTDCIVGLNPLGLPSKILVVFTEAHVAAILPKNQNASVTAELSKASLLVIDNVAHLASSASSNRKRNSFDGGSNQVADLSAMGYVSVSYISSAKATVLLSVDDDGENCLDIEIRDDLFVLESCADSTQTLISTLGKLAPPAPPPSKESKYRTKIVPVKDLLASLSGDAFGTAEGNYDFDKDFGELENVAEEDEGELGYDSDYYKDGSEEGYQQAILEDLDESLASLYLTSRDTRDGVLLDSFVEELPVENEALSFHEDHFGTGSVLEGTAHQWNSAKNTYDNSNETKVKKSPLKVCVRDVHIIWNLFDGYDWQATRDAITKAVQDVEAKATEKRARNERRPTFEQDIDDDEDTEIGDFLFNSIWVGIPNNRDPQELTAAINQELNDNATETASIATTNYTITPSKQGSSRKPKKLRLNRSKHHKITFELSGVCVDLVTFPPLSGETQSSIDVRVHDLEVFDHIPTSTWRKFATYMQDAGEREKGSNLAHIEILNVKPVSYLAASEIVLKVTILPLRLHVDQDALDFITRFFEFKPESGIASGTPSEEPFLQRVEVNSVQVKLDFKPKRVDYAGLRSGHTTEFMNFLILDEADMTLRHTIIYGISGFEKMGKCLNDIWTPDIKKNQLPGILAGLAPVRSIVNVGGGFKDLVVVPMHEYKKDGRLVRSISKGAAAFAKTTGTELIKLSAKVAIGVQTVLQGAEDFLGPQGTSLPHAGSSEDEEERNQISLYANQPVGVFQGLKGGYAGLQRDLIMARDAIIAVPGEVMEGGSAKGVLSAVRKHAPTVILRPAIGVAKGAGQVLMGATNSLDKGNLARADAKYKKH